jgi:UDP-glucose 4-epimerase
VKLQSGTERFACNLGTGTGYSVLEVVEVARKVTGHEIPARVVGRREGDPAMLVSGGTEAKALLDWEPKRADLESIVADAWRFLKAHPNGYES